MPLAFLTENWGAHQDYGWFLAAIGWSIVLAGFWSRAHWGRATPWLAGFAAANLLLPLLELAAFFSASWYAAQENANRGALREGWDLVIGLVLPLTIVFLGMAVVSDSRRGRSISGPWRLAVFGLGLLLAFGLGLARYTQPLLASGIFGAIAAAVGWGGIRTRILRRHGTDWLGDAGLVLWGLLFLTATTGLLAEVLGEGRRLHDITRFMLPAQFNCLVSAAALAVAVWRVRLGGRETGPEWSIVRNASWLLAAWLLLGFAFVQWSSQQIRENYEENLLERVRIFAAFIDRPAVEEALGPQLQIGRIDYRERRGGGRLVFSQSDHARAPAFGVLREQFKRAVEASTDIWNVTLQTPRAGWLAMAVKWPDYPETFTEIILSRPSAEWTAQTGGSGGAGFVLQPAREPWGNVMKAVVPVYGRNAGAPLGWLSFEVYTTRWSAAFNVVRLQAMGVLLTGLLLWATGVGLRLRGAQRVRADALTAAAFAADQAKGILLANVSHELRTPLQGIVGFCDLLQNDMTTVRGQERLTALRQQGKTMARLVNDLLDLSTIESGAFHFTLEPTDLRQLLHEVVESIRPQARAKHIGLMLVIDPAMPSCVQLDAVRVRQIATNLIANAVKFTSIGRVGVELVVDRTQSDALMVELMVSDTGPGIPVEEQAKLFKPFSRLSATSSQDGSGLGLAISAALCRSAGGSLKVESDGANGALFRARFPVQAVATAAGEAPLSDGHLRGRRILVVDDNRLVRELFVSYLSDCGATCRQAANGREALTLAQEQPFDALILDLAMPVMDGWEVAAQLQQAGREGARPRLVGVSAHAGQTEKERARSAGFDVFLTKPVELADLAAALAITPPPAHRPRRKELQELFKAEAPAQAATLAGLVRRGDWPVVASRAHYLKNSAVVVEDQILYQACGRLEEAAAEGKTEAARQAWLECLTCLAPVLEPEEFARLTSESRPEGS